MKRGLLLAAVTLLPRLLVIPLNENLYGDAISRTWLAQSWGQSPHLIGSFAQGCRQFGPLHLYLLALAEWFWPSPEHAGRWLSLVAGSLSAWPLHALTRRLFGRAAATWAVVGFAFWGMHLQCSTTAASEALALLLVFSVIALLQGYYDGAGRSWLLASALALNLACATRYDAWLLVPLLAALTAWRTRSLRAGVLFGAAGSAFAVPWMFGNWVDLGHPLYPFSFIDEFHRAWFPSEQATWGAWTYRWITLFFWPGAALVTLTPPVALAGMVGLWRAWRTRTESRWLVLVVLVPAALYTVRSTVLGSFVPLARFTIKEVGLLLPFVWFGAQPVLDLLRGRAAAGAIRWPVAMSTVLLVAWPCGLGWYTFRREGQSENSLRPISPTSTNSALVTRVAGFLKTHVADDDSILIVDADPRGYEDIQVAFFSGYPSWRMAKLRSASAETRLPRGSWAFVVRFEGGPMDQQSQVVDSRLEFRGARFESTLNAGAGLHVYRRVD
jgi:hypothetical protein